mgnify:CR=1 FL=1
MIMKALDFKNRLLQLAISHSHNSEHKPSRIKIIFDLKNQNRVLTLLAKINFWQVSGYGFN